MARRAPFRIETMQCRGGCGKIVATGNRSLWGADSAKAELGGYCNGCTTPEMEQKIEKAISSAIHRNIAGKS